MKIKQLSIMLQVVTNAPDVAVLDRHFAIHEKETHGYLIGLERGNYSEAYLFRGAFPYAEADVKKLL